MSKLVWDQTVDRNLETGVDQGVLYPQSSGLYPNGVAWNGLTGVTEKPGGADPTAFWADNIKYSSIRAAETFAATVEAYTYPDEFAACDGSCEIAPGVKISQQRRQAFGMCYRSKIVNENDSDSDNNYKLHIIYNATAAPAEKAYAAVNETPEGITFSWELDTTAISVTGKKPTATLEIDSTKTDAAKLAALETILYGSEGVAPRLPLPDEIASLMLGTAAVPTSPTFVAATGVLTIPTKVGVIYFVNAVETADGDMPALEGGVSVVVTVQPDTGYYFASGTNTTWTFTSTQP